MQSSLRLIGNLVTQRLSTSSMIDKCVVASVFLHGNKIAEITDHDMTIFDGGWQSNTTKSRLNALCSEFCIAGEGVFQKEFQWFVHRFVGFAMTDDGHKSAVFNVDDFHSGYVFA